MADGAAVITCRMYDGWNSVRDGFAKNIIAGYGGSVAFLALATIFHWLIFLVPPFWLLIGWIAPHPGYPFVPLGLTLAGIAVRAITAWVTRQRMIDAVFMPLSALLMTLIAAQAVVWQTRGGIRWKGRVINGERAAAALPESSSNDSSH